MIKMNDVIILTRKKEVKKELKDINNSIKNYYIKFFNEKHLIESILKQQKIKKWIIEHRNEVYVVALNSNHTYFKVYYVDERGILQEFRDYLNPYMILKQPYGFVYHNTAFGMSRSFDIVYNSFRYSVTDRLLR